MDFLAHKILIEVDQQRMSRQLVHRWRSEEMPSCRYPDRGSDHPQSTSGMSGRDPVRIVIDRFLGCLNRARFGRSQEDNLLQCAYTNSGEMCVSIRLDADILSINWSSIFYTGKIQSLSLGRACTSTFLFTSGIGMRLVFLCGPFVLFGIEAAVVKGNLIFPGADLFVS